MDEKFELTILSLSVPIHRLLGCIWVGQPAGMIEIEDEVVEVVTEAGEGTVMIEDMVVEGIDTMIEEMIDIAVVIGTAVADIVVGEVNAMGEIDMDLIGDMAETGMLIGTVGVIDMEEKEEVTVTAVEIDMKIVMEEPLEEGLPVHITGRKDLAENIDPGAGVMKDQDINQSLTKPSLISNFFSIFLINVLNVFGRRILSLN